MKVIIAISIFVLGINVSYSQGNKISISSLEPIDTIQGDFFHGFNDKDESTVELKKHVIKKLYQLQKSMQGLLLDTTDLTSFNLYRTKYSDCQNTIVLLVSGFNSYLLSLDSSLGIVDLNQIGENTPALYNTKTGTGNYIRSQSIVKGCGTVNTIKTFYRINKDQTVEIVKQESSQFEINSKGNIEIK